MPSFDSPSVFGSLLDREAGLFRLGPFGVMVPSDRHYVPGTNVMVTTWKTPGGWLEVREALTMGPTTREDTITPHTRPPADEDADHMLVRTVKCLEGEVEIELICEPAFDYGRVPAEWTLVDGSLHTADATGAGQTIRLQTDLKLGIEVNRVRARHTLRAGEEAYVVLGWGEGLAVADDVDDARRRLDATVGFLASLAEPGATVRRPSLARGDPALGADDQGPDLHADRSDGGGADDLAAGDPRGRAQLGLPLHVDARLDVHAPGAASPRSRLGGGRVHAVRRRCRAQLADGGLQIMYGIDGRRDLTESFREDLSGYSGAHPVRIGNGAFDQRQNDVFGAVLDSILKHCMHSQRLPRRLWPIVQAQAECATNVWRQPDQGIWEARGKPQHYVSSKLMCWVALDRAAKLAAIRDAPELQATWQATAQEIHADILEHGLKDGVLRQHYDTEALDASTLLAALFGFLPGDDERMHKPRCWRSPTT